MAVFSFRAAVNATPRGQFQNSSLSAAVGLTAPANAAQATANAAMLQAIAQNIYYTIDGSTPSSTNGFVLYAGDPPTPYVGDIAQLKFKEAAASATLNYGLFEVI